MPAINYYVKRTFWLIGVVLSACQSTSIESSSSYLPPPTTPLSSVATPSLTKTSPTQPTFNPIFGSILPVLKAKTKLPVRLPTYIPESDGTNSIYALLETRTPSEYRIMLAFTKDCMGGTACRLGGVFGEAITPQTPLLTGKAVSLANSITGYFDDANCGVNCSDATLTWEQNGSRYAVAIKAGSTATLVKMANSTITATPLNQL